VLACLLSFSRYCYSRRCGEFNTARTSSSSSRSCVQALLMWCSLPGSAVALFCVCHCISLQCTVGSRCLDTAVCYAVAKLSPPSWSTQFSVTFASNCCKRLASLWHVMTSHLIPVTVSHCAVSSPIASYKCCLASIHRCWPSSSTTDVYSRYQSI
jgi:hypothetical protein